MYTIEKDSIFKKFILWECHKNCKFMLHSGTRGSCKSFLQKNIMKKLKNVNIVEVRREDNSIEYYTN